MTTHDATSQAEKIGKLAFFTGQPFQTKVKITNAKISYGRQRYYVEPVAGKGGAWVDETSLRIVAATEAV